MEQENSTPKILLLHEGGLRDVCELLAGLGFPFVERQGAPTPVDLQERWDLIIASQKQLGIFKGRDETQKTRRIAVIDNDSRTLRSRLQRLGVDYIVARPVHATAMRLLVLHCVYKGPERRRLSRVTVGAKILMRNGLLKREVVLADISLHGCRLICDKPAKAGAKLKLYFPAEMGGGKSFALPSRALRSAKANDAPGSHVVAASFVGLKPAQGQRLRKVFESYKNGPARLLEANGDSGSGPKPVPVKTTTPPERRVGLRKNLDEHVVAVSEEATRVLLCRDISLGGMRVEPNDTLVPGDDLLVAVHAGGRSEPMVVNAKVSRDDGEKGLVLTFYDVSKESEGCLRKIVNRVPENDSEDGAGNQNLIISEIVERRAS